MGPRRGGPARWGRGGSDSGAVAVRLDLHASPQMVRLVVVDPKSLAKYFGGRGRNRKTSTIAEKLLEANGKTP